MVSEDELSENCIVSILGYISSIRKMYKKIEANNAADYAKGDSMINPNIRPRPTAMRATSEGVGGMLNYIGALVSNPSNAIKKSCNNKLGNKYILKSGLRCSNMENQYVHKQIDNMEVFNIFTQDYDSNAGIIPSTVGSALDINASGLMTAFVENPSKTCVRKPLQCHVVKTDSNNNMQLYRGTLDVTVEKEDFTNLNNIINKHPHLITNIDDFENTENDSNIFDKNNEVLFNLYYLSLIIFFIYLLFKI